MKSTGGRFKRHGVRDFSGNQNRRVISPNKLIGQYYNPAFAGGSGSHKLNAENQFEFDADLRRHEALLEMADLVVRYHSLPELFPALAGRLFEITAADATHFAFYDPVKNVMRGHLWDKSEHAPYEVERMVADSPSGWTWKNQQPLIVPDLEAETRFPWVRSLLLEKGLKSYCWLPIDRHGETFRRYGIRQISNECLQRK